MANECETDIVLLIHANSFSDPLVLGIEIFSYINGNNRSAKLAVKITIAISDSLNLSNRVVKVTNFTEAIEKALSLNI